MEDLSILVDEVDMDDPDMVAAALKITAQTTYSEEVPSGAVAAPTTPATTTTTTTATNSDSTGTQPSPTGEICVYRHHLCESLIPPLPPPLQLPSFHVINNNHNYSSYPMNYHTVLSVNGR